MRLPLTRASVEAQLYAMILPNSRGADFNCRTAIIESQERALMNSKLLSSYEKLQMPEALTLEHEALRAELVRWAREPGRIGKAAERVARLCDAHFAREEDNVMRAFGMLHDIASDRARPDVAALAKIVAQFGSQHDAMRGQHQAINTAVENFLQLGRNGQIPEIADLAAMLMEHERIEDDVVYPTVLEIARSVQAGMGI